ncbi:nucleotidyl transferase AbiEii/AbiGii toxin family protein [Mastigocoleus testarum]|uniref:Nucleotidyltransferase n=1 Tax=Mastigocoleus testarum BC008 TaxID=371196 RepID=A0A0V7ZH90_9CYAN|nr:nucleotidyl transferase AbiEii/AbiGii toxin family protein [Mastigocoleus testarum]KST63867.1 hypothetical protein BC008_15545 [Mastigocoleus testarum BC008]KST64202.1 hypothetical protein BC008_16320 [Mastigocoleus testarum BC008]
MKEIKDKLLKIADITSRPSSEVLNYHLLESILRRVSDSIYVDELVLRGGMLTRLWVEPGRRIAEDVDFLALYPFSIEVTGEKFRHVFQNNNFGDGVTLDISSLEVTGIWLETEFPGVRININAAFEEYQKNIQIDVGFGDPLVPAAQWIEYPMLTTEKVKLQTASPEIMFGWKLHGLVEQGIKRWRPKDLYDLMLFTKKIELDETIVKSAIATAFSSRNTTLEEVYYLLSTPQWWDKSKNRSKWKWYTRRQKEQIMPEDFLSIVAVVTQKWESIVKSMI